MQISLKNTQKKYINNEWNIYIYIYAYLSNRKTKKIRLFSNYRIGDFGDKNKHWHLQKKKRKC